MTLGRLKAALEQMKAALEAERLKAAMALEQGSPGALHLNAEELDWFLEQLKVVDEVLGIGGRREEGSGNEEAEIQ